MQRKRQNPESFYRVRQKRNRKEAEVIAVGPGGLVDGKEVTMQVKVGDKVIFSSIQEPKWKVKAKKDKLVIVKQNDILAVIE